jgi:hypothetical protein
MRRLYGLFAALTTVGIQNGFQVGDTKEEGFFKNLMAVDGSLLAVTKSAAAAHYPAICCHPSNSGFQRIIDK